MGSNVGKNEKRKRKRKRNKKGKKKRNSQEGVGDTVNEPCDAKVEPRKVPIHLRREDCSKEDCEEARGAQELEGQENLDFGEVLHARKANGAAEVSSAKTTREAADRAKRRAKEGRTTGPPPGGGPGGGAVAFTLVTLSPDMA